MAQSAFVTLRGVIAGLMLVGPAVSGGFVYQDRKFALPAGRASQLHVNLADAAPEDIVIFTGHPREWETKYEIVVLARESAGVEASDVADAVWVDAYARLMADQQLGGAAIDLVPGEMFTMPDQADTSLCRLTWGFTVKHRTQNDSIT